MRNNGPPLKLRFCILDHLTWLFGNKSLNSLLGLETIWVGYQLVLKCLWQVMMGTYVGRGGALLKAELAAKALEGCKIMMVFRQASTLSKCTITLQGR